MLSPEDRPVEAEISVAQGLRQGANWECLLTRTGFFLRL